MANIAGLKSDISAAFVNNLDATERQKLVDRFVERFKTEWLARVASGTADTAGNRAIFARDKLFDFISDTYTSGHRREQLLALPNPEVLG